MKYISSILAKFDFHAMGTEGWYFQRVFPIKYNGVINLKST